MATEVAARQALSRDRDASSIIGYVSRAPDLNIFTLQRDA